MHPLLEDNPGARRLLLANEAIARGAVEAGVAFAAAYPGTPSTEISEALWQVSRETDLYFEYSVNEKVAMEIVAGASWGGRRALTAMKQVGLNVAADPFLTLGAVGVVGGLVVVTADDPSQHSSQTEQDNRHYARLADVPMLEPASADEARRMTRAAFDLSEDLGLPVLLRTTTRLAHMRGVVTLGPVLPIRPPPPAPSIDPRRFVNLPSNAPANRRRHIETMARAAAISDSCEWNVVSGEGRLGIVASGIARTYALDAVRRLGLEDRVAVLEIGMSWPPPRGLLERFLDGRRRVLVIEELEPFLEQEVEMAAFRSRRRLAILGKRSGRFGVAFEYTPRGVEAAVADLAGRRPRRRRAEPPAPEAARGVAPGPVLPGRPPVLCPGCAHRASFYAAAVATGCRAWFENDIGCYTLGYGPPFNQADHLICMGGAINTAAALSRQSDRPVFAYIGDSTFFHSGITGIVNAVHNGHRFVVVVLDNLTTAMTGHQPHPAIAQRGGATFQAVSIEEIVRACGVRHVEVVSAMELGAATAAMRRAIAADGMAVVISRAPCALLRDAPARPEPRAFRIDASTCRTCGCTADGAPCAVPLDAAGKRFRSGRAAATALPLAPLAPCSAACPAGICAQGYVNHLAAGRPAEALRLIRERVALPGVLGHVCHRPCEPVCVLAAEPNGFAARFRGGPGGSEARSAEQPPGAKEPRGFAARFRGGPGGSEARSAEQPPGADEGGAVPICALKRYAAGFDDPPGTHYLVERAAAAPRTGMRVAVVGSGPAGLQCAFELRMRGHDVTVFERAAVPGGLLALGIPPHRLPRDVLRREIELLVRLGIEMRLGDEVSRDLLSTDGFRAVFLAVGAGRTRPLGVPGEDKPGVIDALEMLQAAALGRAVPIPPGAKVAVIGGGNAAIDAARTAVRRGASDVVVLYRRTEAEMPADRSEVLAAIEEGGRFEFLTAPEEIVCAGNGRATGVRCSAMRLGEPDGSGRPRPVPSGEPPRTVACDVVVRAVGQAMDKGCATAFGAATDDAGRIVVDPETLATSRPGVFAGGDAATGPATVVDAVAAGKRAAWGIDVLLRGAAAPPLDLPPARTKAPPRLGSHAPAVDLDAESAVREAARCLACGLCGHCRVCVEAFNCPAIVSDGDAIRIDEALCNGCSVCAQLCPNGAIVEVPRTATTVPEEKISQPDVFVRGVLSPPGVSPTPQAPLRIVLAGVGGQGSLLAGRMIGEAAVAAGLDVVMSELHGMSQRGGTVVSTVIVGGARGPLVPDGDADVLVAFEPLEAARALRYCSRRTVAVVNTRAVPPPAAGVSCPPYPKIGGMLAALRAKCAAVVSLDATAIAESAGTARAANSAVLGALAAAGVLPFPAERLADAVRSLVPPATVAANLAAFERARAEVIHAGRPV